LIAGSINGYILFLEKTQNTDNPYQIVRHVTRDKPAKVCGLCFNINEEYLCIAYNSNEICYLDISQININLRNRIFEIKFELVCQGFHQGPITSMDVALQRPIIITSSQNDKTIRVWNYLTGHCEYCKIILQEKEDVEKELEILSVAIHPNGYYIAVSDKEMIRFFHLCYKELRFYNNDVLGSENPKSNCHLIKFSHGGHLLAAVSGKIVYIIRSFTRETIKIFRTNHNGTIKSIVFHESDNYLYSVGTDGLVVEYDLISHEM
jgi:WD40 repeat protein